MKNKVLNIIVFIFCIFFFVPLCVKADFGEVRYDITNVTLNNEKITFEGWAFIHKTNNYIEVKSAGLTGEYSGDQKILMRAVKVGGGVLDTKVFSGNSDADVDVNYNFYCELFYKNGEAYQCTEGRYKDKNFNTCSSSDYTGGNSYCYYEDIYFKITFDTSSWEISSGEDIEFQLAVSNNYFENDSRLKSNYKYQINEHSKPRQGFKYNDDIYTAAVNVSISDAAVRDTGSSDYITIDKGFVDKQVKFIAHKGKLLSLETISNDYRDDGGKCAYGEWRDVENKLYTIDTNFQKEGRSNKASKERCDDFLGTDCRGTYYYAIKVKKDLVRGDSDDTCYIATPHSDSGYNTAIARGSHVQLSGNTIFKIKLKKIKLCPVDTPDSSDLKCNNSKELESICKKLTIITDKGTATVRIEQRGALSSVLNPNRTFSGGGFNFGVMYQNNIKWSYVSTAPKHGVHLNELKDAVKSKMEAKIKGYNDYISSINLSNIYLGGNLYTDNLEKQCFSSKEDTSSKDYSGDGITVSCIFTFPEATLKYDGSVSYTSTGININNKYYTPLYYDGDYEITADIVGLSRIYDIYAEEDSDSEGIKWTGDWETGLTNCKITLYPLLYDKPSPDGKYKYIFIYRPIDLNKPFPNRNAGINWYEWISIESNKQRLKDTYNKSGYTPYIADLNNSNINEIKNYNKFNNYLDWSKINESGMSSFITEKDYMTRERVS